jgi:signal peptide peptidase SppA
VLPSVLDVIVEVVGMHIQGRRFSDEELDARIGAAREGNQGRGQRRQIGTIAVLPLVGIIAHRAYMVNDISGPRGTSTEAFGASFRAALADPEIDGIAIDVQSPGGSVFGVPELADLIHESRGKKPITVIANALAASAAYWIGSQGDELVVTPSGEVGSVGVLAVHEDFSRMAEQEGVKVTYVYAGQYKVEGNPFEPLGAEARRYLQSRVDTYYDQFVKALARGRGVAQKVVRDAFGQGRMVGAEEAVKLGMADRVETFEAALERLARKIARSSSGARAEVGAGGTAAAAPGAGSAGAEAAPQAEERATCPATPSPAEAEARPEGAAPSEPALDEGDRDRRRRRLRLATAARG